MGVVVASFLICWFPFALMFAGTPFNARIGKFFEDNHLQDIATWIGKRSLSSKTLNSNFPFQDMLIPV